MEVKALIDTWKKQRLTEEQTQELNEGLGNISMSQSVPAENKEDYNETTA